MGLQLAMAVRMLLTQKNRLPVAQVQQKERLVHPQEDHVAKCAFNFDIPFQQANVTRNFYSGRGADRPESKRDRYAIYHTKPETMATKLGEKGDPIQLSANYFELKKSPTYELLQYRVDFQPECELAAARKYLMYTQRSLLGAYLYDTQNSVYLTHRLAQDETTVCGEDKAGNKHDISLKFTSILSADTREHLQVLNLILRRSMEGLKLQLIGRNLFDPMGKVSSKKEKTNPIFKSSGNFVSI